MNDYLITFHTHFESLKCFKKFEATNNLCDVKLVPVPRELSSSCGTALKTGCSTESLLRDTLAGLEYDELFKIVADEKKSNNIKYVAINT